MSSVRLTKLLRFFFETGLDVIPVVDERTVPDSIIGFLSRKLLDRELADLESTRIDLHRIPERLIILEFGDESLHLLESAPRIPVLNLLGEHVANWNQSDLYRAIGYAKDLKAEQREAESEDSQKTSLEAAGESKEDSPTWLARTILSGFPFPVYCCDIEGNSLFYNRDFERRILHSKMLENRIRVAEKYFIEITRDLQARSLSQDQPGSLETLRTIIPELDIILEIETLYSEGQAIGYLFLFKESLLQRISKEVEGYLDSGLPLQDLLDEMESRIIYHYLERKGHNVSHTAQALGLRRTTLQNRMRRLHIDEKFDLRVDGPIRRNRRTRAELEAISDEDQQEDSAENNRGRFHEVSMKNTKKRTGQKKGDPNYKTTSQRKPKSSKKSPVKKKEASTIKKSAAIKKKTTKKTRNN